MLSLAIRNAAGEQITVNRKLYDLRFSYTEKGGPLSLSATIPIDKVSQVSMLDDVSLSDGFDEIWLGRIAELPYLTKGRKALVLTCEGYLGSMKDDSYVASFTTELASDVIKDIITTKCPQLSTDFSKITVTTFSIPELEKTASPYDVLKELNKYELYDWGIYDRDAVGVPRMTYVPHNNAVIDYYATLKQARPNLAGQSIDGIYNAVQVDYTDPADSAKKLTVTRTLAVPMLTAAGITRSPASHLSVDSTDSTAADQVGDAFLADHARVQGKGSLDITGAVRNRFGVRVPAYRILPGKNIMIRDLNAGPETLDEMTGATVLNGKNIFRIIDVDVDYGKHTATLQLDNQGDRLDFIIARNQL